MENFIHGSSGQTIEMNTNEQRHSKKEDGLFPFMDSMQQDLISRPDMDHILLPSKATAKRVNPKELPKIKFGAKDQISIQARNSRKGAVSTLKAREEPSMAKHDA
jgi:hypothetical protein